MTNPMGAAGPMMNRPAGVALLAASILVIDWLAGPTRPAIADDVDAPSAPEFTHTSPAAWINSPPLALADLRGHVVLLDVWTFDCWNCYRSFPWLRAVEAKFEPAGLRVIGVHSPEFAHEKVRAKVEAKVAEFELEHPVMIDNDFSYWNALGNRSWPTYYLVDKKGRIRATIVGETHADTDKARRIDAAIAHLLAE